LRGARDMRAVMDRIDTLAINASLMREMRIIRFMTELIGRGDLGASRYLRLFIHTIDAESERARSCATIGTT
jgi:NTE family protein